MVHFGNDELKPHFIYCGDYHMKISPEDNTEKFKKMFLKKMKKFGIQSSMLTMLHMRRLKLSTKEMAEEAAEGKLKNHIDWKGLVHPSSVSLNDDLEMLLTNILNSKEIKEEKVHSFFTSKLTEEELKLVNMKNNDHLKTYSVHYFGKDPDVDPEDMKKSDSKSKYVHCYCCRKTCSLTLEKNKKKKFALKNFCNNISII